jgi:putative tricarboxylic transport membrane protein
MLSSQGSLEIFWSNWLVGGIMGLAMILLFWPLIKTVLAMLRRREPAGAPS